LQLAISKWPWIEEGSPGKTKNQDPENTRLSLGVLGTHLGNKGVRGKVVEKKKL
jgi:hypothetical protein